MNHKRKRYIAISLLLVFFLSLFFKVILHSFDPAVSRDGCTYLYFIELWKNEGFGYIISFYPKFNIPPFPLYLVKRISEISGLSSERSWLVLNIILGSLVPIVTYEMTYTTTRKRLLSLFAALLIAFHPSINELSVQIQRDIIYIFTAGIVIWAICSDIIKGAAWHYLIAGFFTAISFLTRYEAFELIAVAIIALFCKTIIQHQRIIKTLLSVFCFFSMIIVTFFFVNIKMGTGDHLQQIYHQYLEEKIRNTQFVDNVND